jgi:ubiquitin-conjugating enzyme E2 I
VGIAKSRLAQERKTWRKDYPFGFVAKPQTKEDGAVDLLVWNCIVPGNKDTLWSNNSCFSEEYPEKPPTAHFPAGFFHPNIYPSGKVCLSILAEEKGWRPSLLVKQVLLGIQDLLDNHNNSDPAQETAYHMLNASRSQYNDRVKKEVAKYPLA